jgi:hypothetical protein
MRHLAGVPWREFRALKPGLEAIAARYETVLEAHHRRDMVDELQAYNRMLNAPEGPARVRELGRFLRHLQDRLADDRLGSYVRERLQHMQTDVRQDVKRAAPACWRPVWPKPERSRRPSRCSTE